MLSGYTFYVIIFLRKKRSWKCTRIKFIHTISFPKISSLKISLCYILLIVSKIQSRLQGHPVLSTLLPPIRVLSLFFLSILPLYSFFSSSLRGFLLFVAHSFCMNVCVDCVGVRESGSAFTLLSISLLRFDGTFDVLLYDWILFFQWLSLDRLLL